MKGEWILWLATDGEVRAAKRNPEKPTKKGTRWLPAWEFMTVEEADRLLESITTSHPYHKTVRLYRPKVMPDDPEVQARETAKVDAEGLLLARFNVDVERELAKLRGEW